MSYLPLNGGAILPIARRGRLGWFVEGDGWTMAPSGSLTLSQERHIAQVCAAALREPARVLGGGVVTVGSDMVTQREIHNRIVGEIVASIVKPPLENGGEYTDVLIVLESVIVGVVLMAVKLGGDQKVLDLVVERVKERLAKQRLGDISTAGSA